MVIPAFLLGIWSLGQCQAQDAWVISPQQQPWAMGLRWSSLADSAPHVLSQLVAGELKCVPCDSTEREFWKPAPGLRGPRPRRLFLSLISLHPVSVRNHSCEVTVLSPLSESPSLGCSRGPRQGPVPSLFLHVALVLLGSLFFFTSSFCRI